MVSKDLCLSFTSPLQVYEYMRINVYVTVLCYSFELYYEFFAQALDLLIFVSFLSQHQRLGPIGCCAHLTMTFLYLPLLGCLDT